MRGTHPVFTTLDEVPPNRFKLPEGEPVAVRFLDDMPDLPAIYEHLPVPMPPEAKAEAEERARAFFEEIKEQRRD